MMHATSPTAPILICYDGSDASRDAVVEAAATYPGRNAFVLTVWEPFHIYAAAYGGIINPAELDDDIESEAQRVASEGADLASDHGLHATAQAIRTQGSIAGTIIDFVRIGDFAVIVVGSQGHGAFVGALLGSVANALAHRSPIPVLLVRTPRHTEPATPGKSEIEDSMAHPLQLSGGRS
jgi:nucleotide-binding universal stress UspA family protein